MDLEMRPLTSGTAFDDRPVFSPDGKQVAFRWDRGGDDEGGSFL
jgi:Tol biopolymer transport system component